MIKNEIDIVDLIQKDEWMMSLLKAVRGRIFGMGGFVQGLCA